jgi:hypothetical protein
MEPKSEANRSRVMYTVRTLESATWLAQGEPDPEKAKVIWERACQMLRQLWEVEVAEMLELKLAAGSAKEKLLGLPELTADQNQARMRVFWECVSGNLSRNPSIIRILEAVYDETLNPNNEHNVSLRIIPARAVMALTVFLPCA